MAAVQVKVVLLLSLVALAVSGANAQKYQRTHHRVEKRDIAGERADLTSLKGAKLFLTRKFSPTENVPLLIHFHGAAWLIEQHVADHAPNTALVTVNLGAGSRIYGTPFEREAAFSEIIDEARKLLGLERQFSSINLSGFSAGYGSIRAILRHPKNFEQVNSVLLLDGLHASYVPEGVGLASGGKVKTDDVDSYLVFGREAVNGKKRFIVAHSEIVPVTYVSTTEASDYLISELRIKRKTKIAAGPNGMRQVSYAKKGNFHVFGYAGDTAPDHVDYLHSMPAWFRYLNLH